MEFEDNKKRKNVVFLSSSFVNIARMFAENNPDKDIFLILDRKFPFEYDEGLDNFYVFIFHKSKIFEKNKDRYFDNLLVFVQDFEPDVIITNNYTKLLTKNFIDFIKFRNSNIKLLNIHHADLRILDNSGDMMFKGLKADMRQMLDEAMIISTIHLIEDEKMDTGKKLGFSYETTLKELKQKGIFRKKEDILNYRLRNVTLSYHERTKVLGLLTKIVNNLDKL